MVGLGFEFNGSTETYSTAGTYTDTVPTGATSVTVKSWGCLLYTSPSPRDGLLSRMPSSA